MENRWGFGSVELALSRIEVTIMREADGPVAVAITNCKRVKKICFAEGYIDVATTTFK